MHGQRACSVTWGFPGAHLTPTRSMLSTESTLSTNSLSPENCHLLSLEYDFS